MTTDSAATVRQQFGRVAEAYVRSQGHAQGNDLAALVALAAPSAEDRALDIATGGGHTALAIAQMAGHVTVTDLTPEMLTAAEGHLRGKGLTNVAFEVADAQALPFEDNSFDIVTCRIAPHHFPRPTNFVREVRRVLRPGGRFVLEDSVVPAGPTGAFINRVEAIRDPSHARSLTMDEWFGLLLEAGFSVLHIETHRKIHELQDWFDRMETPPAAQAEVRALLANATPVEQRAFDIEMDANGVPAAFWNLKAIFLAM